MEREKPTFDILGRIEQERLSRSWSEYALAENSGLPCPAIIVKSITVSI